VPFVAALHAKYREHWQSMLAEPFLSEVAQGSIGDERFANWLRQDYVFVREAIPSLGLKLAKAPLAHREALSGAIAGLERELVLFEEMAAEHGVTIGEVDPLPTNLAYINFIRVTNALDPYELGYAVTYAAEKAYLESWLTVKREQQGPSKWQRFIDNWTSPGFESWVASLSANLDELADAASESLRARMERKFFETMRYERLFWKMAFYGESW
jgi:thiaminase/transcriptional activator TenA